MHIAIAGNIGAGKTTLTQLLADHFGWTPLVEATQYNPYLEDFYDDMLRWSFPLQIYFLNSRFRQMLEIQRSAESVIQDRTIYEDAHIFARNLRQEGLMTERDYQTYEGLYRSMLEFVTPPDLLIYLRAGMPRLHDGIRRRGRAYEHNIPDEYLQSLNQLYEAWIAEYTHSPLLVLDVNERDFLHDAADHQYVLHQVEATLGRIVS
ncbi:Deoxyadenosine/deoxycytidine kinase [Catalinimonas alkaloidigena]|uniref:Deoxyadenosine/deoxycytidine kinase n=1 Tax=Catalinimonas alkaloidigena TaxID=1075417 RepID=A0A1G8YCW3_9BACT|nr:deoxynucleoside kinase [Catalinimonas alkaloidigena]SDK00561.1 Deoxyadenosine/deoxycytidine kinase [Catalinimonas alkaloidigena]